jgi:predicted Zn-dependent protease
VTRRPAIRLPLAAVLLCALLSACATHRAAGPPVPKPSDADVGVGERAFPFARQTAGGDFAALPDLSAYVKEVGRKVAAASDHPGLPYDFVVIDNPVPSAWSLPGGKVAIHRGLLTELESEAELAAVLGHAIAHAAQTEGARRLEADLWFHLGTTGVPVNAGGGRQDRIVGDARLGPVLAHATHGAEDEAAADGYGMRAMAKAGYDPGANVALLERFLKVAGTRSAPGLAGLLAAHPPSEERVAAARDALRALPAGGFVGAEEYRAAVAPLKALAPAYERLAEGERALARGDADAALTAARDGVEGAPGGGRSRLLEGRALLALGRPDEARAALDEAVARDSGYFLPWLVRGEARRSLGDAAGARDDLMRSLTLLPTDTAHLRLGELDLAEGRVDDGKRHLRAAREAGGAAATEAGETLARMELLDVPGRYVAVGVGLDPDGFMFFTVENRAPLKVRDVKVRVTLTDPATGAAREAVFTFDGPFAPRERARRETHFGPFAPEVTRTVRTEVVAAHLAE